MDDLDLLLADAAAEVERAKKERRKVVTTGGFVESDYRTSSLVAMFNAVRCLHCSAEEMQFEGLFEERTHRRNAGDKHLVRLPMLPMEDSKIPRTKRYLHHAIPYCSVCSDIHLYKEGE